MIVIKAGPDGLGYSDLVRLVQGRGQRMGVRTEVCHFGGHRTGATSGQHAPLQVLALKGPVALSTQ